MLTVPVGDVLVGDTRGNIEHDDTTLSVDVVTVTETTELLLTCGVPNIELDLAEVLSRVSGRRGSRSGGGGESYGGETKRVNFDTESGDVLLLELSSQVTLDESGLFWAYPVSLSGSLRVYGRKRCASRRTMRDGELEMNVPFRYRRRQRGRA